jgi:hypothetical protein
MLPYNFDPLNIDSLIGDECLSGVANVTFFLYEADIPLAGDPWFDLALRGELELAKKFLLFFSAE